MVAKRDSKPGLPQILSVYQQPSGHSSRSLVLNQPPLLAKKQNEFVCSRYCAAKLLLAPALGHLLEAGRCPHRTLVALVPLQHRHPQSHPSLKSSGGKEVLIYTFKQDGCKKTTALYCCRFALYKLPKHAKGEIPMLGLEYMYMDALAPQWQLSKYLINMTQGALGQTLKQLYETYESEASDI